MVYHYRKKPFANPIQFAKSYALELHRLQPFKTRHTMRVVFCVLPLLNISKYHATRFLSHCYRKGTQIFAYTKFIGFLVF
jgi:hypothetical protein